MNDSSKIEIKLLQKSEWEAITSLKVAPSQSSFIESSKKCLDDAIEKAYMMTWNFYGVYAGSCLIGFAMHGRQVFKYIPYTRVWLDRFMIDEKYQGMGYGKRAIKLVAQEMYKDYNCKKIFLSVIQSNVTATMLYKKLGFKKTWFKDPKGERIMTRRK